MSDSTSAESSLEGGDSALPESIGSYRILRRLGGGPMGDVFMGKAPNEARHAIKMPRAPQVKVADDAHRLLNNGLDPRIRPYLEIDYDDSRNRYMAMDYLEVGPASLSTLDGLDAAQTIEWGISSLQALGKLHAQGIVHGNIKNSNLLVRRSKESNLPGVVAGAMPIFGDIGLRYAYDPEYFAGTYARQVFPYMAPEAIEAFVGAGLEDEWKVEKNGDVYAWCVTFIEAYSGFQIFDLVGEEPTYERYIEEKHKRRYVIVERNDSVSRVNIKRLNEIVACCLDPKPENRFADAQQLEQALQETLINKEN